jgi:hypothetical protein
MESDRIRVLIVDAFYDINFSASWPIWSKHPERWPDAASGWHVLDIGYEKSFA